MSFLFDKVASLFDREIEEEVVQASRDYDPARVVSFLGQGASESVDPIRTREGGPDDSHDSLDGEPHPDIDGQVHPAVSLSAGSQAGVQSRSEVIMQSEVRVERIFLPSQRLEGSWRLR